MADIRERAEEALKVRPIIFSGPMVRAILEGRKTQTRRIVKPQPGKGEHVDHNATRGWHVWADVGTTPETHDQIYLDLRCPYGQPGDRLWVREAWQPGYTHSSVQSGADASTCEVIYRADNAAHHVPAPDGVADRWDRDYSDDGPDDPRWRPSIHMPRWASRLTLEITEVRVQRLQDISEADAIAEGLSRITKDDGKTWKWGIPDRDGLPGTDDDGMPWSEWSTDARKPFAHGWDTVNGKRAPWVSNPWVWVVKFKRIEAGR